MSLRDLIHRPRGGMARRSEAERPWLPMHERMSSLFDDLVRGFDLEPFGFERGFKPRIDVDENDREVRITAELPGMDENDIEVSVERGALTLRGEKKQEREETEGGVYRMERTYGSFHRMIPLPEGVDQDKANAEFKKGVLTITLPKRPEAAASRRHIDVKTEE